MSALAAGSRLPRLTAPRRLHVHDASYLVLDLLVRLGRRKIDEARGEVSEEAFEPYGLIQGRLGLRA